MAAIIGCHIMILSPALLPSRHSVVNSGREQAGLDQYLTNQLSTSCLIFQLGTSEINILADIVVLIYFSSIFWNFWA